MNFNDEDMLMYLAFALVGAFLMAMCIYAAGCKSPYPVCNEAGVYRCAGSAVELCDGRNWNPRKDCAQVWKDGLNPVVYECRGTAFHRAAAVAISILKNMDIESEK